MTEFTVHGGGGNDGLTGGILKDQLFGESGGDHLDGRRNHDTLDGGLGGDTLSGGAGDDILDGGLGVDVLLGGTGNDTYLVDDTFDLADEGAAFAAYAGSAFDIDTIFSKADWFWDVYSVGERLIVAADSADSGAHGITIVGSAFSNEMTGNAKTNMLFGRGGSDIYGPGTASISSRSRRSDLRIRTLTRA